VLSGSATVRVRRLDLRTPPEADFDLAFLGSPLIGAAQAGRPETIRSFLVLALSFLKFAVNHRRRLLLRSASLRFFPCAFCEAVFCKWTPSDPIFSCKFGNNAG